MADAKRAHQTKREAKVEARREGMDGAWQGGAGGFGPLLGLAVLSTVDGLTLGPRTGSRTW